MNNPDAPATKRQTWALFCITKEDYRNKGLTKAEASDLIKKLGDKNRTKTTKPKKNSYVEIYEKALTAGLAALKAATPTPMVVQQHANMMDDNSPVVQEWFVADGPCGFAWVNVKCKGEGLRFVNAMKKHDSDRWRKDGYYGGYTFWVREGNQSIQKKEAFAEAFAEVLREAGINAHWSSRLD
jgi:hypothetical protein